MASPQHSSLIPLRWPAEWRDASVLDQVRQTPINALLTGADPLPGAIAERARALGLRVLDRNHPPADVKVVNGEWPGMRLSHAQSDAVAGPTGAPWLDSNIWRVRLARALNPGKQVWIRSELPKRLVRPEEIPVAVADAAIAGGLWIITLPPDFKSWPQLGETLRFFAAHPEWPAYAVKAALGVVSSFSGADEPVAAEVLNLTSRMHQPCRILLPSHPLPDLRAVIYTDGNPPSELRAKLLAYVRRGGLLVATSAWGQGEGSRVNPYSILYSVPVTDDWGKGNGTVVEAHPRFTLYRIGAGRLAVANETVPDPYLLSSDAQVLMSHRHDPVAFWNAGTYGSHLTTSPAGGVWLHLVNYAARASSDPVTVRIRGDYRKAVLLRPGESQAALRIKPVGHAAEIYLPEIATYAGLELT
jgi:hypothetical protein